MAGQAIDRAVEHVVAIVDVLRSECSFKHDVLLKILHAGRLLQFLDDPPAVGGEHLRPVVMGTEVGSVDQHIERLAPRWRHPRLSDRRCADIAGGIVGRFATAIDRGEFLVRIGREDKVVVDELLVALVEPEIEHNT